MRVRTQRTQTMDLEHGVALGVPKEFSAPSKEDILEDLRDDMCALMLNQCIYNWLFAFMFIFMLKVY